MAERRRRGRARALRQWRLRTRGRRHGDADGAGGMEEPRGSVRGKRRSAAPLPRRRPRGRRAVGGRRRGGTAAGPVRPPSESGCSRGGNRAVLRRCGEALPGCEKRRLTARGGTRPVSGSGSWLSRAAPEERERSRGSRRVRARHGVRPSGVRFSLGSSHRQRCAELLPRSCSLQAPFSI